MTSVFPVLQEIISINTSLQKLNEEYKVFIVNCYGVMPKICDCLIQRKTGKEENNTTTTFVGNVTGGSIVTSAGGSNVTIIGGYDNSGGNINSNTIFVSCSNDKNFGIKLEIENLRDQNHSYIKKYESLLKDLEKVIIKFSRFSEKPIIEFNTSCSENDIWKSYMLTIEEMNAQIKEHLLNETQIDEMIDKMFQIIK